MDLEYEWFCLVGASTGGTSFPVYVWLHRGLSCYSIRKPQVAQKLKLKAMPSKLESTVQWKKICQKAWNDKQAQQNSWMGASVLPFIDGRVKGQNGTSIMDLLGKESLLSSEIAQHNREKKHQGMTTVQVRPCQAPSMGTRV